MMGKSKRIKKLRGGGMAKKKLMNRGGNVKKGIKKMMAGGPVKKGKKKSMRVGGMVKSPKRRG